MRTTRLFPVGALAAALSLGAGCTDPFSEYGPNDPTGQRVATAAVLQGKAADLARPDTDEGGPIVLFTEDQSIELGMGYDSVSGEFITNKKCVLFLKGRKGGEQASLQIRQVTDQHSLSKALEVEASVEVDALLAKTRGKAKFSKDVRVTSSFVSYAVHAHAQAEQEYARGIPLDRLWRNRVAEASDEGLAETLYHQSGASSGSAVLLVDEYRRLVSGVRGPERFTEACGDSFVSTLFQGVELAGVITLESTKKDEQSKFSASVKSSGAWWKGEGKAATDLKEVQEQSTMTVRYYESGDVGQPLPVDIAGMMERAQDIKALLRKPRLYKVAVTPYSRLANWSADDLPIAGNADMEAVLYHYAAYQDLFETAGDALEQLENETDPAFLFKSPSEEEGNPFWEVTEVDLRDLQDELQDSLARLRRILEGCDKDGWNESCGDLLKELEGMKSPYAFRARMPLPADTEDDLKAAPAKEAREALAKWLIWQPRDRACAFSPEYAGCISNREARTYVNLIPVSGS